MKRNDKILDVRENRKGIQEWTVQRQTPTHIQQSEQIIRNCHKQVIHAYYENYVSCVINLSGLSIFDCPLVCLTFFVTILILSMRWYITWLLSVHVLINIRENQMDNKQWTLMAVVLLLARNRAIINDLDVIVYGFMLQIISITDFLVQRLNNLAVDC